MLSYKDWYDKIGYKIDEEVLNWLNDAPSYVNLRDMAVYDTREYVEEILNSEYESYICDIDDRAYDEYKDSL